MTSNLVVSALGGDRIDPIHRRSGYAGRARICVLRIVWQIFPLPSHLPRHGRWPSQAGAPNKPSTENVFRNVSRRR